jgi:hypothetical protein
LLLPPGTPSTDQLTPVDKEIAAVNCCACPVAPSKAANAGEIPKVKTDTAALAALAESATLVAVIVWVSAVVGGIYKPPEEIVPTLAFPPCTPSTDQLTAVFESETVAVNCCPCPVDPSSVAEMGEIAVPVITVTEAFALLVVCATLVAVTVCEPGVGGAVYKPALAIVPTVEFPPLTPSTDHVTDVLLEPLTVAVNWLVDFTTTLTVL